MAVSEGVDASQPGKKKAWLKPCAGRLRTNQRNRLYRPQLLGHASIKERAEDPSIATWTMAATST